MRLLINPLENLPFPDYSLYRNIPSIAGDTYPTVFMTRGCPFSCSYCHNSNQRKIYKGKGKYVRSFSIERILSEVESAIFHYPKTKAVFLGADTLGSDLNWLSELLTRYCLRFDVPYNCLIRPEFINKDLVKLLKETNCHMIAFGIESGSERIRKKLLKRNYSNEQNLLELGTGFHSEFTGRSNIYLSGAVQGFTKREMEERIDGILEFAELGEFIDQPIRTYSSGMVMRARLRSG